MSLSAELRSKDSAAIRQPTNLRAIEAHDPRPYGSLQRYFEISLYLMLVTGFFALASTGSLTFFVVLLVGAAMALRGYFLFKGRSVLIEERWTTILTVAYIGLYLIDYVLISGSFLNATVHLVLFVMVLRLFSAKKDRDYYFLAALAFLMILAASVLTVDSLFLLTLSIFLLTAVATFILMEMRNSAGKAAIQANGPAAANLPQRMAKSLATAAPVIVLQILLGAAAIFFVLPRVSGGYLSAYAMRNELATGFSSRVELGQIGQLQQLSAVVMHIQIDGDREGAYNLKWRGVTLNVFDGKVWTNSHESHPVMKTPDGRFLLSSVQDGVQTPRLFRGERHDIHYHVLMEPTGSNLFFLAPAATEMRGNYRQIWMDRGDTVSKIDDEHAIGSYEAWSDITRPAADKLRAATGNYPLDVQLEYLQLPMLDPRIPQLARTITTKATNDYDRAAAVERYLLTHFSYTLQLSKTPPSDPVAEFLFIRKQGHCEYFATSMAVMLRTLGIPSRVVNGFRPTEFNDVTSQYVVRDSDAHSWVEAFFPGYGWVSFDPTPGITTPHTAWAGLMQYLDAMQTFWRERVIEYDANQQVAMGAQAINTSRHSFFRMRRWMQSHYASLLDRARHTQTDWTSSAPRYIVYGGLLVFVISLFLAGPTLWRAMMEQRLAGHPEKAPKAAAELWYDRMVRSLARKGWRKLPTQTPGEFARRIGNSVVREKVDQFTENYEWARFGESPDHARKLPELYESVVESLSGK